MEKEKKSTIITDIKRILDEKKEIIGTNVSLKEIKKNNLKKVYLTSNIQEDVKKDIIYYAGLANIDIIETDINNEELGIICKKPFLISILGEKK